MFKEHNISDFETVIIYDRTLILDLKRKKHSDTVLLDKHRIKIILDVILYNKFLHRNKNKIIAKDPM